MDNTFLFSGCAYREFYSGEKHITRRFNQNVLIFMLSGVLRFSEDGEQTELKENEYYIQKKGLFQEGTIPSDSPKYFYIHFYGDCNNFKGDIPLRGKYIPAKMQDLFNILDMMGMSIYKKQSALYEIFDRLSVAAREDGSRLEARVKEYIDEHFKETLTLETLSREFLITRHYLEKCFRECYDITVHKYITEKRMDEAKFLLLAADRSIEQVAYSCGYNEFSVFYRNFVACEGISPLKWKKKSLGI